MLKYNLKAIMLVTFVAAFVAAVSVVSCSKVDTTYTAQFAGTWVVDTDRCTGFDIEQFDIATGSTNYTLNVTYRIGPNLSIGYHGTPDDTCQRKITIQGITNSTADKDYFSINTQTFNDRCGKNYSVSGSAKIKRSATPSDRDTLYVNLITGTTGHTSSCTLRGYR